MGDIMFFSGKYCLAVDEKGRFRFPEVWEKDLGKKIFVSKINEKMINVKKGENIELLFESLSNGEIVAEQEKINRVFANSSLIESDAKGRFTLPPSFGFSGTKNIYAVGSLDCITLFFNQEFYDKMIEENDKYKEMLKILNNG